MSTDGFERVSDIIGEEMDRAFRNVMDRVMKAAADGNTGDVSSFAQGATLSVEDLQNFITCMGGAMLDLQFVSNTPKGGQLRCHGGKIGLPAGADASAFGGEISVSIGGRWTF